MQVGTENDGAVAAPSETVPVQINTMGKSLLHGLVFRHALPRETLSLSLFAKTYVIAAGTTYGLMMVLGLIGSTPLTTPSPQIRLPFLNDWNTAFLFLLSFPTLVMLLLSDDAALRLALRRVQQDQVVTLRRLEAQALQRKWNKRFANINVSAQVAGLLIGSALAAANYMAYVGPSVGFWIASNGRLLPIGYAFIVSVWLFYTLIPIYIIRIIAVSVFLGDVVRQGHIRMMPFHPDKCGGLRPVGTLGLRNQYGLTVFGVNLVSFTLITVAYLNRPQALVTLIVVAVVAYMVAGPVVFVGPLLPFRGGMLKTKAELMSEVAHRLRIELLRLRGQLAGGPITRDDEELIDRLRKIGLVIDELPVWPFDAGTLRRFLGAYVIPLIGAVAYPIGMAIVERLIKSTP
jgi:hypothetical protein